MRCLLSILAAALALAPVSAGRTGPVSAGLVPKLEFSRGGAGVHHTGVGPCGADPRRSACVFQGSTLSELRWPKAFQAALHVVALDVSNATIAPLERINVTATFLRHTPTVNDWVGAYCVDDERSPPQDREYIDYQKLTATSPLGPLDATNFTFGPLVNMRCSWQFRFFTQRGDDAYILLATSPFVRFLKGKYEPLHVHTAKTTAPDEMRVMWVSANTTNATPFVQFGETRDKLTRQAFAETSETYKASDMCEAPATTVAANLFRDPGVMYSTVLKGLQADKTYYYCVCNGSLGSSTTSPCSAIFKMRTPPAPGSQNGVASFFVYGDLGDWTVHATGPYNPNRSGTTMDLIRRDMNDPRSNYVAVLHIGDLSYGKGSTFLWDQFGALIEPVASEIPYMVGIGNHEYCYESGGEGKDPSGAGKTSGFHPKEGNYGLDSQGECGVPTDKRFIMPANGNKVFWWSTEMGLVHHTMISSEHDYRPGSDMYKWLEKDLKSVDRKKTPWLFLHLHRPMYTSEQYEADNKVSIYIRKNIEGLLGKYKVDAVFSGHYHAYELTCPVYKEVCRSDPLPGGLQKAKAPVHIMVGSAGADIDNVGYYDVPWRVDAQLEYGYGRVHVHNVTHAKWEFVRNRDEKVASSTWIISDHDWSV